MGVNSRGLDEQPCKVRAAASTHTPDLLFIAPHPPNRRSVTLKH
jgi:hypothetical protein